MVFLPQRVRRGQVCSFDPLERSRAKSSFRSSGFSSHSSRPQSSVPDLTNLSERDPETQKGLWNRRLFDKLDLVIIKLTEFTVSFITDQSFTEQSDISIYLLIFRK